MRSRLPRETRGAISLDVLEKYYVDDAWAAAAPGSGNKYDPLAYILPEFFSTYDVRVSDQDPQFCSYRPDLQALCG